MDDGKRELASGMKRLSEDLYDDGPGDGCFKKFRKEENMPSKVVHIRSIPSDCTDTEVVQLGLPFGRMNNILVMKQKNQAFLEMESESVAKAMVNYYRECPAFVRGKKVYLQYSKHQELKTDQTHAHTNAGAQAALHAAQTLVGAEQTSDGSRPILRVIVDNMLHPVTIDALHKVFSRFGSVLRIVTFSKNNTFQALVQFSEVHSAQTAREALDGVNVYNGCCTLRIDFSKLTTLSVRFNNDKSRDFTNPSLPSGDSVLDDGPVGVGLDRDDMLLYKGSRPFGMAAADDLDGGMRGEMGGRLSGGGIMRRGVGEDMMRRGLGGDMLRRGMSEDMMRRGMGGDMIRRGMGEDIMRRDMGEDIMRRSIGEDMMRRGMGGDMMRRGLGGDMMGGGMGSSGGRGMPRASGMAAAGMPATGPSSVVLISNLNEEMVTPDRLFTLFGVYGDVIRVKILYNKKDNALIQFNDPIMAQLALQNLDRASLWDKVIRVAPSKHMQVQLPRDGQDESNLTRDYSNSPLHRFKKPGSKNFQNIFPPSSVLHLSNISSNVEEEELIEAFGRFGTVTGFKFFQKDRKMALIGLKNVEEATHALIGMHDHQFVPGQNLRVSFSKSKL